jgi:hypothetical protein
MALLGSTMFWQLSSPAKLAWISHYSVAIPSANLVSRCFTSFFASKWMLVVHLFDCVVVFVFILCFVHSVTWFSLLAPKFSFFLWFSALFSWLERTSSSYPFTSRNLTLRWQSLTFTCQVVAASASIPSRGHVFCRFCSISWRFLHSNATIDIFLLPFKLRSRFFLFAMLTCRFYVECLLRLPLIISGVPVTLPIWPKFRSFWTDFASHHVLSSLLQFSINFFLSIVMI